MQGPVEVTLTEEEERRNGRRLDLLYMASSHPLAPDVFELADAAGGKTPAQALAVARDIDPKLAGISLAARNVGPWKGCLHGVADV